MKRLIAIDCETTGLDFRDPETKLTYISYFTDRDKGQSIKATDEEKLNWLRGAMVDEKYIKLFFNAKFDLGMLERRGFKVKGPIEDVMLMAQLTLPEEDEHGLKFLARKYLNDPYIEEVKVKQWLHLNPGKGWGDVPAFLIEPYNLKDARNCMRLYFELKKILKDWNMEELFQREMQLLPIVREMEDTGIKISKKRALQLEHLGNIKLAKLKEDIQELTGIKNPGSNKQLTDYFFTGRYQPTRFSRKTGKASADELALLEIGDTAARKILRYRKVSKAVSTYVTGAIGLADKAFVINCSLNQCGTRTGRFSSSKPNLQNLPRYGKDLLGSIRTVFRARKGYSLLLIDYKQIELRLAAHFSREKHMLKAIRNGQDLHGITCQKMFEITEEDKDWKAKRFIAKTLNFAVLYGIGAQKFKDTLMREAGMKISLLEASQYLTKWKDEHPRIMELFNTVTDEIAETGGVRNPFGRFLPVDMSAPYVGVNYLIQSTAADLIKDRMLKCHACIDEFNTAQIENGFNGGLAKMLLQVHDELIFELHDKATLEILRPELVKIMEEREMFSVPIEVSTFSNKYWVKE